MRGPTPGRGAVNRFSELETFVAVVEAGSLSAAAARLGIAVSAVSRRVGELETRLGVRLANRSTRGFAVTPLGLDYYARCVRLLADLEEADASVSGADAALGGTLRLAAPLSFGVLHLAPALERFLAERPALALDLDLSDRRVDLVEEGIDLAIRIGRLEDSRLVARRLFEVHHVVAASPRWWDRHGRPRTPSDLAGQPALRYRARTAPRAWRFTAPDGRDGELRLEPRYTATNGDVLLDAAVAGLGVVREPTFLAASAIADGRLEPVLLDHAWEPMAAYVVYPQGRPLPARARRLLEHLVATFDEPCPWDATVFGVGWQPR